MSSDKTPWAVCAASLLTFVVAFGTLALLGRMERDSAEKSAADAGEAEVGLLTDRGELDRDGNAEAATDSERRATVRGRVVDPEGRPIAGATAYFLRAPEDGSRRSRENPIKVVETGEDGVFSCHPRALPPKFRLLVRAEGHARWQDPSLSVDGRLQIDLGDVVLDRGLPLIFTVRDGDGAAVPAARILVRDPEAEIQPELARAPLEGVTDQIGVLALPGGDFGDYRVTITKSGHAPFENTFAFDMGSGTTEHSMQAVLPVATEFIEGVLVDPGGFPVRSVTVAVEPLQPVGGVSMRYRDEADPLGRFRIGPLPGGNYQIALETSGMQLKNSTYAEAGGDPVQLVVTHGGSAIGLLSASRGLRSPVELTVWERDGRGHFNPLSNLVVPSVDLSTGRFRIDGLPPGSFRVRAEAEGYAATRSEPFDLDAGQCHAGLELALDEGGRLRGRAVGSRGEALSGVRVLAFEGRRAPADALMPLSQAAGRADTFSQRDGSFALTRLSAGLHVLRLEAPGLPTRTLGPIAIASGEELRLGDLGLGSGGSLSGTVLDAEGGPAAIARVSIRRSDGAVHFVLETDENGNFSAPGLDSGEYHLEAFRGPAAPGRSAGEAIQLGQDENLRRTLTLPSR